ncbi:MAG: magnesium/cobalt transporter CorA [Candidatus Heimdallarchaeota archaeon]|nr:magnesium/cobalt transporter CorA [Candidatus Heimdallarchaeota archaeon]
MIKRIISFSKDDSKLHDKDLESSIKESLGTIWIDLIEPSIDELNIIQKLFGFHSLTIEDCLEANQRPKLEEYHDYVFFILAGLRPSPEDANELESYQIAFYLGKDYVISVREKRGGISLKSVHNKILLKNNRILSHNAAFLSYVLVDAFIDGYLDILEGIEDTIEDIEEIVVHKPETTILDKMFDLRTNILIIIKAIRPQRVVFRELSSDTIPQISESAKTYFTDVYDHILEANDLCSSYRDRVSNIVEIYLSSASNKMNDTMRLIAVLTAVITIPNLIASLGGVNFYEFYIHGTEIIKSWPFWSFIGTIIFTLVMIVLIFRKMKL